MKPATIEFPENEQRLRLNILDSMFCLFMQLKNIRLSNINRIFDLFWWMNRFKCQNIIVTDDLVWSGSCNMLKVRKFTGRKSIWQPIAQFIFWKGTACCLIQLQFETTRCALQREVRNIWKQIKCNNYFLMCKHYKHFAHIFGILFVCIFEHAILRSGICRMGNSHESRNCLDKTIYFTVCTFPLRPESVNKVKLNIKKAGIFSIRKKRLSAYN